VSKETYFFIISLLRKYKIKFINCRRTNIK